jgi:glycerol uptake facilitator-like aquaporin
MIHNGYETPRILRPPSATIFDDVRKLENTGAYIGKNYIKPAVSTVGQGVKFVGKEALKESTTGLPAIGTGLGVAGGIALSGLSANPELSPYLASAGGFAGKTVGKYVQQQINREIDKL